MISPVIDERIQKELVIDVIKPVKSEQDNKIIELSREQQAPILTRDWDFEKKHREGENHYGIIFDHRMHHRNQKQVINAIKTLRQHLTKEELKQNIIWLKRFY